MKQILLLIALISAYASVGQGMISTDYGTLTNEVASLRYQVGNLWGGDLAHQSITITSNTWVNITREALSIDERIALEVSIYPNPVQHILSIESVMLEDLAIELYNLKGIKLETDFKRQSSNKASVDLTQLSPGIYFLKTLHKQSQQSETFRILKQH